MDRRGRTKNLACEILRYSGPALKVHKKEKKAMKYMFASDIHGSAYYCKKMLEAYDKEKADRLVLLGDILYHGPRNDLPKDYAPKEVIALLNERKDDLYVVRGNCDAEVDQMVLKFPIMADYCINHGWRAYHLCKSWTYL